MKRTKSPPSFKPRRKLPDVIDGNPESNFTQINNDMIRDPNLSLKGVGLLCLLQANKKGWTSHESQIMKMKGIGRDGLRSGLLELEKKGYLLRLRYVDATTKKVMGSFIAHCHTPWQFKIKRVIKGLIADGYEVQTTSKIGRKMFKNPLLGNPLLDKPLTGKPLTGNQQLITLSNNNTNNNKTTTTYEDEDSLHEDTTRPLINLGIKASNFDMFWNMYPKKIHKGKVYTAWKRLSAKVEPPSLANIMKALQAQKKSKDWKKENGKYIPHPTTWLNQSRWLDDLTEMDADPETKARQEAREEARLDEEQRIWEAKQERIGK